MQVAIDLPNDFVETLTPDVVAREMRMTYALALFKDARVTLAKAAELAGMNVYEFMSVCKTQRVPVIDISRDELVQERHSIGRSQ
jgi:predicted HTH domain antitoxin